MMILVSESITTAISVKFSNRLYLQFVCAGLLFYFSVTPLLAANSDFVSEFVRLGENKNFNAQAAMIEQNMEQIPDVVKELIAEAMVEGMKFEERMYLLNLASTIAAMHMHWNYDEEPQALLDPIIAKELEREKARVAEIMKWKKQEHLLGNFVMKRHAAEIDDADVAPVLYPHWMHRIYYECKVCHTSIFEIKRWSNNLSHSEFDKGEYCAKCHDGELAFATNDKKECTRCHIAGQPEAARLLNPDNLDHEAIQMTAKRIGAVWRPENLSDGKLPLDSFSMIDWLKLKRDEVFLPLVSLDKNYKEETRDNRIIFVGKSESVSNVLFDHKIHSDWIECSTCHPAIFEEMLGGNRVRMVDMEKGRFCGHCHGRVSFTFADCTRCHAKSRSANVEPVLHRPESDKM